jgi:hypothetical protein
VEKVDKNVPYAGSVPGEYGKAQCRLEDLDKLKPDPDPRLRFSDPDPTPDF